ncbi:hypothetical protein [Flavobacterium sp.]|uniref:hypothetical protein n=1 Tax=Flavobacterium sp. TaxID=239 RepID=UPI003D1105FD
MESYTSADIPATINFQNQIIPLQDEYKKSIFSGEHSEKEMFHNYRIGWMSFDEKCQFIYEIKLRKLCWDIIEEHNSSDLKHIDLKNYQRFKDLVFDALFKTSEFLERP